MAGMINERASTSTDLQSTPTPVVVTSQMRELADNMCDKVASYLQGQIDGTIAEYKLLEEMNTVTTQRYDDMKEVAKGVAEKLSQLSTKYETILPFLQQIEEIDDKSRILEEAAFTLDQYVTGLENKFREVRQDAPSPQ